MSARREARAASLPAPPGTEVEDARRRFPKACYVCKTPFPLGSAAVVCNACLPARIAEIEAMEARRRAASR